MPSDSSFYTAVIPPLDKDVLKMSTDSIMEDILYLYEDLH